MELPQLAEVSAYQLFYRYGRFLGSHPLPFLLLPTTFSLSMVWKKGHKSNANLLALLQLIPIILGPIPLNEDLFDLFSYYSDRTEQELAYHDEFINRKARTNLTFVLDVM